MEKLLTAVEVGEVTLLCVRSSKTLARLNASDLDCLGSVDAPNMQS